MDWPWTTLRVFCHFKAPAPPKEVQLQEPEESCEYLRNCKDFIAGGGAGMLSLLTTYVFDTIKVHQQLTGFSFRQSIRSIYKVQGFRGFYRGVTAPLLANGLIFATFFGTYTSVLEYAGSKNGKREKYPKADIEDISSMSSVFLAGCVAGFSQTLFLSPIDLIKVQMQVCCTSKKANALSSIETVRTILKHRGIAGMGIGLGASMAREIHPHGIYVCAYKYILDDFCGKPLDEDTIVNGYNPADDGIGCYVLAGGVAGLLCWWSCLPLDVIKSHIQGDSLRDPKYKGFIDCTKRLYGLHGYRIFCRGIVPISIRAFMSNGITFASYEKIREFIG